MWNLLQQVDCYWDRIFFVANNSDGDECYDTMIHSDNIFFRPAEDTYEHPGISVGFKNNPKMPSPNHAFNESFNGEMPDFIFQDGNKHLPVKLNGQDSAIDDETKGLGCMVGENYNIAAILHIDRFSIDKVMTGQSYVECELDIINGPNLHGTIAKYTPINEDIEEPDGEEEMLDYGPDINNEEEMYAEIIDHGVGGQLEDCVYDFLEKHDMTGPADSIIEECKQAVFQVLYNAVRNMAFLNSRSGWQF